MRPCPRRAVAFDPVSSAWLCWQHEKVGEPCLSEQSARRRRIDWKRDYRARLATAWTETLYKVLGADGRPCNGGSGEWFLPNGRAGNWMPKIARPEPCVRGYHVVRLDQLLEWLGPRVFEVEIRGDVVGQSDKIVASQARLLRETAWNDRSGRHFAADCAERALRRERRRGREPHPDSWAATKAARDFADGVISDRERDAAWAAARDAARAAARAAAWAAAWDAAEAAAWAAAGAAARDAARAAAEAAAGAAARDAARAAAWVAAWAAAWDAARDAAGAAAGDAERRWQTARLLRYLNGELPKAQR